MLSKNKGFSPKELNNILKEIRVNIGRIKEAWDEHCG
jgi:hypothetical protein